jgi:hypothetical protein
MIEFNKEYFNNNYYFLLKEGYNKISLFYSVENTLTESRKSDEKLVFEKKDEKKVKALIDKFLKTKKKLSKKQVKHKFDSLKNDGEMNELVDDDGTMNSSSIPIINQTLTPHKTTDQTVAMSRVTNDPVTRGYRVYWGESEDEQDNVVSEVDYSDAFGYEETKDKSFNDTVKTLKKMGVENPIERAEQMGKDPKLEKKRKKGAFIRQRLVEKDPIDESRKQAMTKMVEDILAKKSKRDGDVIKKNEQTNKEVSKFLMKNLKSIKKLAEKEGISLEQLIKTLKYDE